MAWVTPKTNWTAADGVRDTDLNRIEGNTLDLRGKLLHSQASVYVSTSGNDTTGDGTSARPFRTINKAISTLPKNLNGFYAYIYVAGGNYPETVEARGFHGGRIILSGNQGTNITINGLYLVDNYIFQISSYLTVTVASNGMEITDASMLICGATLTVNGEGIRVLSGSTMLLNGTTTTINNSVDAIRCSASRVIATTLTGTGNTTGLRSVSGGVIAYSSRSLEASVAVATSGGGKIYAGSQTQIPAY